jgi:hypothetical protein
VDRAVREDRVEAGGLGLFSKKTECEDAAPETKTDSYPETGKCEENNYHHQYPGCPHNVCPYTGRCYPDESMTTPPATGGTEDSETKPAPKKATKGKKVDSDKDACPARPDVDTMEFRPSDRKLNEYGPGGPF